MTLDVAKAISKAGHGVVSHLKVNDTLRHATEYAFHPDNLKLTANDASATAERAAFFALDELAQKGLHEQFHQAAADTLAGSDLPSKAQQALSDAIGQINPEDEIAERLQHTLSSLPDTSLTLDSALNAVSKLKPADAMVKRVGQSVAHLPDIQAELKNQIGTGQLDMDKLRGGIITTADVAPPELAMPTVDSPNIDRPELAIPDVKVPSVDMPDIEAPLNVDGLANQVSIPLADGAGGELMDDLATEDINEADLDDTPPPPEDVYQPSESLPNPYFTDRQHNRHLQVECRIDGLVATHAVITEQLSALYSINLTVHSDRHDITPGELMGTPVWVKIWSEETEDWLYREGYVTGLVAETVADAHERATYHITLEPWLALLRDADDCYIYQDLSPKDAIDALLKRYSDTLRHARYSTAGIARKDNAVPKPYLVQHNESALDYLNRLCRRYHIAYYFEHEPDKGHILHFSDSWLQTPVLEHEPRSLMIHPGTHEDNHLTDWGNYQHTAAGAHTTLQRYDCERPLSIFTAEYSDPDTQRATRTRRPDYRYEPHFHDNYDGRPRAEAHWHEADARSTRWWGHGNYRHLLVGHHINVYPFRDNPLGLLRGTPRPSQDYTITDLVMVISEDDQHHSHTTTHFSVIDRKRLLYPLAGTDDHRIPGLETAVVTGPPGQEIYCDQQGRIKIQFHWDRHGQHERTSCWVRVMNHLAGKGFGEHYTPRVGEEVVVTFIQGDPDQPIVLGTVYHTEHLPPFADKQGRTLGVRTRSSPKGTRQQYNEVSFDDTLGEESVLIQAQRDFNALIKHKLTRIIGENEVHRVGGILSIEACERIHFNVGESHVILDHKQIEISSPSVEINGDPLDLIGPVQPIPPPPPPQPKKKAEVPVTPPFVSPLPPVYWVELELKDDLGSPIKGQAWSVKTPDGDTRTGMTDGNGVGRAGVILTYGVCEIHFPGLKSWEPYSQNDKVNIETTHTIVKGESLHRIAKTYGFAHSDELYHHPDNKAFRELRPNKHLIYPGDKIKIPADDNRVFFGHVDERHPFTVPSEKPGIMILIEIDIYTVTAKNDLMVLKHNSGWEKTVPIAGCPSKPDGWVEVFFENAPENGSYTLWQEPKDGQDPFIIFDNVPFADLADIKVDGEIIDMSHMKDDSKEPSAAEEPESPLDSVKLSDQPIIGPAS